MTRRTPPLVPAVAAVMTDAHGAILFIRRRDNRRWALPAGAVEPLETVYEALCREVLEETGLAIVSAVPFAIYSGMPHVITDSDRGEVQLLIIAFRVDQFQGELIQETNETIDARFFAPNQLDDVAQNHVAILRDLDRFHGSIILG